MSLHFNTNKLNHILLNTQVMLANAHPQLAPTILHLQFQPSSTLDTMGVDRAGRVYYSPAYVGDPDMTVPNLAQSILHEALHLFLDYFPRQHKRESHRWNVAHDLEIFLYAQPKIALRPANFQFPSGKTAEWYYDRLPDQAGGGACSQHQVPAGEPTSATERAIIRTAEEIVKKASARPGELTSLERHALSLVNPTKANNRLRQLQGSMLTAGLSDFSYERPNRRMSHRRDVVMPALIHREPRVIVILDVSGSMQGHLPRATAAVISAVKTIGASLDVVAWDTQPIAACNVRSARDLARLSYSWGGTDMAAAILNAPKRGRYDAILVVTDCETPWPAQSEIRRLPPIYILNVGHMKPPPYLAEIKV